MDNGSSLEQELSSLSVLHRVAFASVCSERLLPDYLAFSTMANWGDYGMLTGLLDTAWKHVKGHSLDHATIQNVIDACLKLAPHSDLFPSHLSGLAQHAVGAVYNTLHCCLDGKASHAAAVGQLVADSVDMYLCWVGSPYIDLSDEIDEMDSLLGIDETELSKAEQSKRTVSELQHRQNDLFEWVSQSPLMKAECERQRQEINFLRRHPDINEEVVDQLRSHSRRCGIRLQARGVVRTT